MFFFAWNNTELSLTTDFQLMTFKPNSFLAIITIFHFIKTPPPVILPILVNIQYR